MEKTHVIAIDGPAGSGKSTVARSVARRLGILYLDSGAVYRTVTLLLLRNRIDITNQDETIAELLRSVTIDIEDQQNGNRVLLNGEDVTREIRSQEVTAYVSTVSEDRRVRSLVNDILRDIAAGQTVVLDGRDIGTAVFPDADLKIFMDASLSERARRRHNELTEAGNQVELAAVKNDILRRDKHDSERELAPLKLAEDAIMLDTTNRTIDECVEFIVNKKKNIELQT